MQKHKRACLSLNSLFGSSRTLSHQANARCDRSGCPSRNAHTEMSCHTSAGTVFSNFTIPGTFGMGEESPKNESRSQLNFTPGGAAASGIAPKRGMGLLGASLMEAGARTAVGRL